MAPLAVDPAALDSAGGAVVAAGAGLGANLEKFLSDYGPQLDRIGGDQGKYLAIMEHGRPASWEQRALHVTSLRDPYHAYTIDWLPEGWFIEVSEVAPGCGQPGGSIQVRIFDHQNEMRKVEELIRRGVLRQ